MENFDSWNLVWGVVGVEEWEEGIEVGVGEVGCKFFIVVLRFL